MKIERVVERDVKYEGKMDALRLSGSVDKALGPSSGWYGSVYMHGFGSFDQAETWLQSVAENTVYEQPVQPVGLRWRLTGWWLLGVASGVALALVVQWLVTT